MALTQSDLKQIGIVVEKVVDAKLEEKLEQKLEEKLEQKLEEKLEQKLTEHLGKYPTKDEFYTKEDELMGELKAMREEVTVLSHHVSTHSDQIDALQSLHPNNTHMVFSS
jgi:hypothetical protein